MIIFLLKPDKRIDMVLAKPKSSVIETRKGHLHFLNVPEAIYTLFGVPTALAYHKYGAILPAQNIIYATEMRDRGFKNIGEVEKAITALKFMLIGDKKNPGLYLQRDVLVKTIGNPGEGKDEEKEKLAKIETDIKAAEEELFSLQNVEVAERGFIRIQDIFNYLNRNLSTDVIFSIIERSVAEEMRGMRDLAAKFVQMFPFILTLLIFFVLAVLIFMNFSNGNISMPSLDIIPKIGP